MFAAIRVDHGRDEDIKQILAGGVDWSAVRQFALRHGVLPLLYARLKSLQNDLTPGLIPVETMKEMQVLYLTNAQRNLRLSLTLFRVLGLLSEAGIQALPLKGPVLAEQLYGDTSLRQFADLDIFIRPEDFHKTYQELIAAGFRSEFPLNKKTESWLLKAEKEHSFFYQDDMLEVHWAIAEKSIQYPLEPTRFWEHLHPVELNGRRVYTFSLENLFLMLCIHGTKHMWNRLIWVSDVSDFIETYPEVDWKHILEHAAKLGFYRLCCLGLLLAEQIGGVNCPTASRKDFVMIQ